jgi:YegS/Rv2252/BmrU family lipid kinase
MRRLDRILELLRQHAEIELYPTSQPGDAVRAAKAACAKGVDAVIAAGGDGTINEVVNGLIGGSVPLGVIPLGTANVLAAELGIPREPRALVELIAHGPIRDVWVGLANGRRFVLMASAGFDADVVRDVDPALKRAAGKGAFVFSFVAGLVRYSPKRLTVRVGDLTLSASQVLVAKAARYGGNFIAAPRIGLDQPEFCIFVVDAPTRRGILGLAIALARGRLSAHPSVRMLRASEVSLTCDEEAVIQADGEVIGDLPARIAIDREQVRVIAPARQRPH